MVIRVSRRSSPESDAAKAATIVRDGGAVMFTGDVRHLRRIHQRLSDVPSVDSFMGADDFGTTFLHVTGEDGGWLRDHV